MRKLHTSIDAAIKDAIEQDHDEIKECESELVNIFVESKDGEKFSARAVGDEDGEPLHGTLYCTLKEFLDNGSKTDEYWRNVWNWKPSIYDDEL